MNRSGCDFVADRRAVRVLSRQTYASPAMLASSA
jgi:hypothetical protein